MERQLTLGGANVVTKGLRILWVNRVEEWRGSNSLSITATQLCKAILDLDPYASIVFPYHEAFGGKEWMLNYSLEKDDLDRIHTFHYPQKVVGSTPATRKIGWLSGPAMFHRMKPLSEDVKYIDAMVVDGCTAIVPQLRMATHSTFQQGYGRQIPCISYESWTPTDSWKNCIYGTFDTKSHLLGALYSDRNYYQSTWCMEDHLDSYRNILKPSVIKSFLPKLGVINTGVWSDTLPRKSHSGDKPVIMWSGHFQEDYDRVKEPLFAAYKCGVAKKLIFHFMVGSSKSEIPERILDELKDQGPDIEIRTEMTQSEYHKFIIDEVDIAVGLGLTLNQYGGRYVEMAAMGVLLVTNDIYAKIIFPDWENYPFRVGTNDLTKLVYAACRHLKDNPDFTTKYADAVREFHDVRTSGKQFYDACIELRDEEHARTNFGDLPKLAEEVFEGCERMEHATFISLLGDKLSTPQDLRNNPIFPPGILRWVALSQGYVDVSGPDEPTYVREDLLET